jgi:hypothetical protein
MHPFLLIGGVLHATAALVIAFFVLFAASKATGLLKLMGAALGGWLIILAIAGLVFAALAPAGGTGRYHMGGWMMQRGLQGPAAPGAPAGPTP